VLRLTLVDGLRPASIGLILGLGGGAAAARVCGGGGDSGGGGDCGVFVAGVASVAVGSGAGFADGVKESPSFVDAVPALTYTVSMEVHLTPEQEAELSQLAVRKGRDPNTLAQEVLALYLKQVARFVEAVKRGIASAERGRFCGARRGFGAIRARVSALMRIRWTRDAADDLERIAT